MPLPIRVRYSFIDNIVASLLAKYAIERGRVPVEKIAVGEGNTVRKKKLEDDVSGFLLQTREGKIIGVNGSQSVVRQRFTIAHELGHSKLHELEAIHVDHGFRIDYRNHESSRGKNTLEKEANYFAAGLLMPESFLQADLADKLIDMNDEELVDRLATKYEVSSQAMSYRLINIFG